jgi:hypothetical protein
MKDQATDTGTKDTSRKSLYRVGAAAPLVTLTLYAVQIVAIILGEPYPTGTTDWLSLFQRSKVLGLLYLNALDVFSITILGLMFLALHVALKRTNESYMAIATFLAFLGIAVFVTSRADAVSASLALSDQHAAAMTEAHRAQILAAWRATAAPVRATIQTTGFLFTAAAGLIISVVMRQSNIFGKTTAYAGILAGVVTFADHVCIVVAPAIAGILMPVVGLLWLVWWILVGRGLFRLGRHPSKATSATRQPSA